MTWQGWEALLSATEQDCAAQEQLRYEQQVAATHALMFEEMDVDSEAGSQADQPISHESANSKGKRKSREAGSGRNNLPGGPCTHCGCKVSPQWRRPTGQVLCNACGIFWNRHHRLPPHKKIATPVKKAPLHPPASVAEVKEAVKMLTTTVTTGTKGEILLRALPAVRTHIVRKYAEPPQMAAMPATAAMATSASTGSADEPTYQDVLPAGSGNAGPGLEESLAVEAARHLPRRRLSPPSSPTDSNLSSHHHMPVIGPTLPALSSGTAGQFPASPVVTSRMLPRAQQEQPCRMLQVAAVQRRPVTTAAVLPASALPSVSATMAAAVYPAIALGPAAAAAAASHVAAVATAAAMARQPILLRVLTCSGPKRARAVQA